MSWVEMTRYPVLLVHGAGFRDLQWPVYWGRIPSALERCGARVFYGRQDCWASTETNARELVGRIDAILAETGAEKVNIIA
ncbi:MAG: triacylglycerol lipase, partial [Oscillospiraceae bacterium]|nr:triacylglycerol lipase [Oscillospiraceae bacterium]